jgi:serine/threonine-protein kinase
LDFGLAKALGLDGAGATSNLSDPPTLTSPATMMGMVLGTAAYMAPEQARGRAVDRRADIWSFGAVLFEMLTSRRLFDGDDVSVTLAGVLKDEPDWSLLPASTPAALHQLLRRTLVKDPKQRLQSIGEARILIDGLLSGSVPMVPASFTGGRHPQPSFLPWAVAAAAIAALATTVVMWAPWRAAAPAAAGPVRASIIMPADLSVRSARISLDGTRLILRAFVRREEATALRMPRLYSRPLEAYEAVAIPGTDGVLNFWESHDGRWLAVLVGTPNQADRRLMKVPVNGSSPPVLLAHWEPKWHESLVWLEDGDLLTWVPDGKGQALLRIPGGGGTLGKPLPLKIENGSLIGFEGVLPGGNGVFAWVDSFGPRGYQVNVSLLDPKTGSLTRLIDNASNPVYLSSGHLIFSRDNTILATRFDLENRTVSGDVTALEAGLYSVAGPAEFELTHTGTLAYIPSGQQEFDRRMVVVAADGTVTPFIPQPGRFVMTPGLSPDGSRAAVTILNQGATYESWVADAARGTLRRLVVLPSADISNALWSPDGRWLAYVREGQEETDGIYIQSAGGSGEPRRILDNFKGPFHVPISRLPDGSALIVTRAKMGSGRDLLLLPVAKDGTALPPSPLVATSAEDDAGVVSPDGRLIAYVTDETGKKEVYVAAFNDGTIGPAAAISDGACGLVQWVAPRRLVYCATPGTLVSVDITDAPALAASKPLVLHDLLKLRINLNGWRMRSDGRLIGFERTESEDALPSVNVVLNWETDVQRRLAGAKR